MNPNLITLTVVFALIYSTVAIDQYNPWVGDFDYPEDYKEYSKQFEKHKNDEKGHWKFRTLVNKFNNLNDKWETYDEWRNNQKIACKAIENNGGDNLTKTCTGQTKLESGNGLKCPCSYISMGFNEKGKCEYNDKFDVYLFPPIFPTRQPDELSPQEKYEVSRNTCLDINNLGTRLDFAKKFANFYKQSMVVNIQTFPMQVQDVKPQKLIQVLQQYHQLSYRQVEHHQLLHQLL